MDIQALLIFLLIVFCVAGTYFDDPDNRNGKASLAASSHSPRHAPVTRIRERRGKDMLASHRSVRVADFKQHIAGRAEPFATSLALVSLTASF